MTAVTTPDTLLTKAIAVTLPLTMVAVPVALVPPDGAGVKVTVGATV